MERKQLWVLLMFLLICFSNCDGEKRSSKEICENGLRGVYSESTMCRITCRRLSPYKVLFDDFLKDGEVCFISGVKGSCRPGLGCVPDSKPPSFWG